jgi:hypothetical protein
VGGRCWKFNQITILSIIHAEIIADIKLVFEAVDAW